MADVFQQTPFLLPCWLLRMQQTIRRLKRGSTTLYCKGQQFSKLAKHAAWGYFSIASQHVYPQQTEAVPNPFLKT